MTVTAVQITSRPAPTGTASRQPSRTPEPAGVVIVADVEALTTTNQRGCGNDNPYT
ncbi:hypothetical protein [Actinoplanes sp. NPDC026623]|uniref:hypothetical protein n=1 Tax=Actinoplanes sp. NPDC026623 TaxID=3155610 RepID=UPI0033D89339